MSSGVQSLKSRFDSGRRLAAAKCVIDCSEVCNRLCAPWWNSDEQCEGVGSLEEKGHCALSIHPYL